MKANLPVQSLVLVLLVLEMSLEDVERRREQRDEDNLFVRRLLELLEQVGERNQLAWGDSGVNKCECRLCSNRNQNAGWLIAHRCSSCRPRGDRSGSELERQGRAQDRSSSGQEQGQSVSDAIYVFRSTNSHCWRTCGRAAVQVGRRQLHARRCRPYGKGQLTKGLLQMFRAYRTVRGDKVGGSVNHDTAAMRVGERRRTHSCPASTA